MKKSANNYCKIVIRSIEYLVYHGYIMSQSHSDKITDPSIRRLFEEKNFVFVSTLMSNGYPHTTPTWVDIEDGNILINTTIGRIKQKNVSRDPRLSIAVVDHDNPYDMV